MSSFGSTHISRVHADCPSIVYGSLSVDVAQERGGPKIKRSGV